MKVKILKGNTISHNGESYYPEEVIDIGEEEATRLIDLNVVELFESSEIKIPDENRISNQDLKPNENLGKDENLDATVESGENKEKEKIEEENTKINETETPNTKGGRRNEKNSKK